MRVAIAYELRCFVRPVLRDTLAILGRLVGDIAEALCVAGYRAAEQSNFIHETAQLGMASIAATHDAPASAEVVVGPKIWLY